MPVGTGGRDLVHPITMVVVRALPHILGFWVVQERMPLVAIFGTLAVRSATSSTGTARILHMVLDLPVDQEVSLGFARLTSITRRAFLAVGVSQIRLGRLMAATRRMTFIPVAFPHSALGRFTTTFISRVRSSSAFYATVYAFASRSV